MADSEDEIPEIEIQIRPDDDTLDDLGVSAEEFEQQLEIAISDYRELLDAVDDSEDVPGIEEIEIELHGRLHRLGDLAAIRITGDLDALDQMDLNRDTDVE